MNKITVGILFGGKSAEHEISLQSATNILDAIDREKFEPVLIGIDKQGTWHIVDASRSSLQSTGQPAALLSGSATTELVNRETQQPLAKLDVVFPIVHGPMGEDGTVQGMLKLADIPFVGADVLGSAVGMDKDVMKRLLRDASIPIAKFIAIRKPERDTVSFESIEEKLGLPCFIKPANMGSSVGVSKVTDRQTFEKALTEAFRFDTKVIIEEAISGLEVECAILGNDHPIASIPGAIVPRESFYSYNAKYLDENGAELRILDNLPANLIAEIQELAIKVFNILECKGLGRVDMFLTPDNKLVVNEINTLPGFTKISMYPRLWEASGIPYSALITRLIELALEWHAAEATLATSYS